VAKMSSLNSLTSISRQGLVGRKCGMTRQFTPSGDSLPVTIIEVLPNVITQIKTLENDGYRAVQVTMGKRRISRVTKPLVGHYAKAKVEPGLGLWEFTLNKGEGDDLAPGAELKVDCFEAGQYVDVTGTTKGAGFAGVIKRYNFRTQDATHGNSRSHRAPGSIGQNQSPGRVFKGKKMAGQMGNVSRTIQSQPIVKIDAERHLLFIHGAVPGAVGGFVIVKPAIKAKRKINSGEK
jgi:large subunit ribosomal protein L3